MADCVCTALLGVLYLLGYKRSTAGGAPLKKQKQGSMTVEDIKKAHVDLENRKVIGPAIIVP